MIILVVVLTLAVCPVRVALLYTVRNELVSDITDRALATNKNGPRSPAALSELNRPLPKLEHR